MVALTSLATAMPSPASGDDRAEPRAVSPVADYRFRRALDSENGVAPALFDVGPRTSVYAKETVGDRTRTVYQFPKKNGVALDPASSVVSRKKYTIAVLMRFDDIDGYRRIVTFNQRSDYGLYSYGGQLKLYNSATGPDPVISADEWVLVVLTRTGAGIVKGYVNGELQFEVDDSTDRHAVISKKDVLAFFRDDSNREESAGAVARIRLFDRPLSEAKVANLRW